MSLFCFQNNELYVIGTAHSVLVVFGTSGAYLFKKDIFV